MRVAARGVARSDAVLLLAAAAVAMSVALAVVSSRPGNPDDRARAIERQLRCPTCQGLSIADSPATSATQMRALVREQLAAGVSDDAVRAFFVARYGRWILLDPPASGPDLALWLAPAAILAAGAVLVVRRARSRGPAGAARRWSALPLLPVPRLGTLAVGTAMVLALAVPIAAAIGPRLAGREVSGGGIAQAAPSIEDLEAFVRAEPGDVGALVALGDALLAANRAGDAADRYEAALDLDPNNVGALLGVGAILLGADRPDAAGPVFDRILTLRPDQPDALLYRAVARLRLEGAATDQVRRDIQRFLEVASPTDPRRTMAAGLLGGSDTSSPGATAPVGSPRR
jgi:cytochrome c-type biogenesis protein CcmH